jgi:hypothetical protein
MMKDFEEAATVREERVATFAKRTDLEFMIGAAEALMQGSKLRQPSKELLIDLLSVLYESRKRVAEAKVIERRLRGKEPRCPECRQQGAHHKLDCSRRR